MQLNGCADYYILLRLQSSELTSAHCAGVTIKKTVSAFVIGIYDQSVAAGDANVVVENLGDYLIEQNI